MTEYEEPIYKGLVRPAMVFGVPLAPLVFTCLFIVSFSLMFNPVFIITCVPAIFIMREICKKDDFAFRILGLKIRFITNPILKKYFGIKKTYNANSYSKHLENFDYPKLSVLALDKMPTFEKYLPYQTLLNNIVVTKDYDFLATFEVEGVEFELADEDTLAMQKSILNMIFNTYSSENISFYHHNIRFDIEDSFNSKFPSEFLQKINDSYFNNFSNGLKSNKHYMTIIYTPFNRPKLINFKNLSLDKQIDILNDHIRTFKENIERIESNLSEFGVKRLGIYEEDNIKYSKQLEFYNYLISGEQTKIALSPSPIFSYLTGNLTSIMFENGYGQLNLTNGTKKFVRLLEIKDYSATTFSGILDSLMYSDCNYIITQSFTPMAKNEAKDRLTKQRKRLISSEDDALSQIDEIGVALNELINGEISFGNYHFSICIYGKSIKEVENNTNNIITAFNNLGIMTTISNMALPATFFAQFPANFGIRPRINTLSSLNYASLTALHSFPKGKREQNQWGEAVTILKTPNLQPFYFNFHETVKKENSFTDKKELLANTLVFGMSGGGKTVLMNFLLNQLCKYSDKSSFPKNFPEDKKKASFFFLDKDKGGSGNIIACGGKYLTIDGGKATGFNPFMVEKNNENIRKLQILIKMLVTRNNEILTTLEEEQLNNAVTSIMTNFEKEERKFGISLMLEHLTEGSLETNSVKSRLRLWSKGQKFGWIFDNENDELNFLDKDISLYGIDGTDLLKDDEISSMVAFYILWRIMDMADGRRFALFIDEAWDWISNPVVADEVFNKFKTIRKENGFLVLGTQSVEDFAKSKIATALIEQSATILLLGNMRAKREDYIEKLSITDKEFEFVKNTKKSEYQFIVKKGEERAIVKIDLKHIGNTYLKILSTGKSYVDYIMKINDNKNLSSEEKFAELKKIYE